LGNIFKHAVKLNLGQHKGGSRGTQTTA